MTKFDLQYTKMVAACPELHQGYVHLEMVWFWIVIKWDDIMVLQGDDKILHQMLMRD